MSQHPQDNQAGDSKYNLGLKDILNPPILLRVGIIGLVCLGICGGLAFAAGWFQPRKLTQDKIVDRLESLGGPQPGFRRNHAKGVCATGYFTGTGNGVALSKASVFEARKTPVFGRFALAGPNPFQPDTAGQVRSMALNFTLDNGQAWRTGMNNIPVFTVKNAQGFYDLLEASKPDPDTGKPDSSLMAAFFKQHPESVESLPMIKARAISTGFANTSYNALNAFYFINASGKSSPVRWSMTPVDPFTDASEGAKSADTNYLFDDLADRFDRGPVEWTMSATLASEGDPLDDATKAWPEERQKIELGTLTLTAIQDEGTGPCRDINFDPLVLPDGIAPSADPLLSARSAAYSRSFTRRAGEQETPSAVTFSAPDQTPNG